ncbi:uncharacterized protein [Cicer arietinum]|uniref:uncharacterized protein isoform X2 n=1 Tax=Cicer arietinum TaxID=3827 RepID=UPI0006414F4F
MEGDNFLLELRFFINLLCKETLYFLSVVFSDPLFSCIVTLCVLILIYLPHSFCKIVFSPVPILSAILLIIVLRFGAIQRSNSEEKENLVESESVTTEENRENRDEKQGKTGEEVEIDSLDQIQRWVSSNSEIKFEFQMGFESSSFLDESFVEWNVKAPLEVIYEGEETEDISNENLVTGILRYPSLSRYCPESDSDSSSENEFPAMEKWDSPENMCYMWDEEDRDGLIEIALDGCKNNDNAFGYQFEEENMIEIDISPTKRREFSELLNRIYTISDNTYWAASSNFRPQN